jgi:hypothetical protein
MMARLPHRLGFGRAWLWPALAIVLLAGHGAILYAVSLRLPLWAGVLSGVAVLLVLWHVGLLGRLYSRLRRGAAAYRRPRADDR